MAVADNTGQIEETRQRRERLLWVLSAATFLIFFQAYMVAPLIPRLAHGFEVSEEKMGLIVPAYLLPYGFSTLFFGLLSDRLGRRPIMVGSLLAFALLTALTATARSASEMTIWRLATGLGASGVVPLALSLVGQFFPYEKRGRPMGWLFGAMAGGAAFGSTVGVIVEPFIGWRMLFIGVAVLGFVLLGFLAPFTSLLDGGGLRAAAAPLSFGTVMKGYKALLLNPRGARTYGYVLLNGIFHSGVFTWLGVYFAQQYHLSEVGIGLALLGYGIPGFLLGPAIGRAADKHGRRWLLPLGFFVGAIGALLLAVPLPLIVAALAVTVLSLGYDMTQPLLAGIVTALGKERGGQAMGLNVFVLFTAFGMGSLLFGRLSSQGFSTALSVFFWAQLLIAFLSVWLFWGENSARAAE